MLSLVKGDPVAEATLKKGQPPQLIKIYGAQDMHVREEEPHLKVPDTTALLDDVFYKSNGLKAKPLLAKLQRGEEGDDVDAAKAYMKSSLQSLIVYDKSISVFPLPQLKSERLYIAAPSGAGKSWFTADYITRTKMLFQQKKRDVYIFSRVEQDESLDKKLNQKYVIRVPLDAELWNSVTFNPEDFEKSICVFDDVDQLADRTLKRKVQALRQNMLETGRHSQITVITTSHQIQNYHESRAAINESHSVVLFPKASSVYHVSSFLEKYVGMTSLEVKRVYNLPTRWIFVHKQYPRYLVWEHGVRLL